MSEELSKLVRDIANSSGSEIDLEGLKKVRETINRIGAKWPDGCVKILEEKNKPLLDNLYSCESHVNSLLLIKNKPPMLMKQFKKRLAEYEHAAEMCVDYASRYINK